MICAYDPNMRPKAQVLLGRALDFAVHEVGYLPEDFMQLFMQSGFAKQFERGNPAIIMGKNGVELVFDVLERTIGIQRPIEVRFSKGRSKEYWIGWALAYYQWVSNSSFWSILLDVPMDRLQGMYRSYHEMDIQRFVDAMDTLRAQQHPESNLKQRRLRAGLTQEQLADASGVPVRTIQEYEQRRKDINQAQVEAALALARALYCEPADLLERAAS